MELRIPTAEQLQTVYDSDMKAAFPAAELKPLSAIRRMWREGRYKPYCLFDGDDIVGECFLWLGHPGWALLDYLCVSPKARNAGLGALILAKLREVEPGTVIFGEAEAPENGAPAGEALRRRRLGFYLRNGFRYGGYDCALFGVHYQTLIRGREDVTPEELLAVHQRIYRSHMPPHVYQRFIQIPLAPGETPNPPGDWIEE